MKIIKNKTLWIKIIFKNIKKWVKNISNFQTNIYSIKY